MLSVLPAASASVPQTFPSHQDMGTVVRGQAQRSEAPRKKKGEGPERTEQTVKQNTTENHFCWGAGTRTTKESSESQQVLGERLG